MTLKIISMIPEGEVMRIGEELQIAYAKRNENNLFWDIPQNADADLIRRALLLAAERVKLTIRLHRPHGKDYYKLNFPSTLIAKEVREVILKTLEGRNLTVRRIHEITDISKNQLSYSVRVLFNRGLVIRHGGPKNFVYELVRQ